MYIRDYYFRDELEYFYNLELAEEWNHQKKLIEMDKEYYRPNNRMTMNIIEEILEIRQVKMDSQNGNLLVKCLNCSEEQPVHNESIYIDEDGTFIVCVECEGSFDV